MMAPATRIDLARWMETLRQVQAALRGSTPSVAGLAEQLDPVIAEMSARIREQHGPGVPLLSPYSIHWPLTTWVDAAISEKLTERANSIIREVCMGDPRATDRRLLHAILRGGGVAQLALKNLGVTIARFVEVYGDQPDPCAPGPEGGRCCSHVKDAVRAAAGAADELGHRVIGSEHLLLGMVEQTQSPAAQILASLGVNQPRVRSEILKILGAVQ